MHYDYPIFEVTDQHLTLVRAMQVGWNDGEFGAPEIDPKRPYGNSNVVEDIADLLDLDSTEVDDDELYHLHRETQTVLQIAIDTGQFSAGRYVRDRWWGKWRKAD